MDAKEPQARTAPAIRPCPFAIAAMTVPAPRWTTRTDLMVQIARAEQFMREAPLGEVSIPDAANIAGVSLHHFIRLFHEVYSVSPRAYLSKLQFERSMQLLKETNATVLEVASEIGFTNASAFARFFKSRAGCTPTDFRRQSLPAQI